MKSRAGQIWELERFTRHPLLHLVLREEPDPMSGLRSLRLLCLETGEELNRSTWLFEEGNEELKASPAMQRWRRVL